MEEMVEPDRTIMIVSIIGLVVIWGSVAYHKFVQGGGPPRPDGFPDDAEVGDGDAETSAQGKTAQSPDASGKRRRGKRRQKR